jgi:hypothetical protein
VFGEWWFGEHVFASGECLPHQRRSACQRDVDDHSLDAGCLPEVSERGGGRPALLGSDLLAAWIDIPDGGEEGIVAEADPLANMPADRTKADDSDAERGV